MMDDTALLFLEEFIKKLREGKLVSFKFNPKDNDGSRTFSGRFERR